MLTLDPVVSVNVSVGASVVTSTSYDVGLIVTAATEGFPVTTRVKAYSGLTGAAGSGANYVIDDFAATTDVYKAAALYFGVTPAPQTLLIGVYASGETQAEVLDAIRNINPDWYGVYWDGATPAQIIAVDAYLNSINYGMQFGSITGDIATGVIGQEPLRTLTTNASRRTALYYYVTATGEDYESAAIMGAAMGCSRVHSGITWQLCYKTITGLVPSASLSQAAVTTLQNANVNVCVTRAYNHTFYERGATPEGMRIDEVIALDRMSNDLQGALLSLIANNPVKMPQTDSTTSRFIAAVTEVLEIYRAIGYITEGIWRGPDVGNLVTGDALESGYAVWADSFDTQSDADRKKRLGMPIHCALHLCGSVESIELNVTVQE